MRRVIAWLAPVVPLVAVFACGGRFDGIGPGGGGGDGGNGLCPAPSVLNAGAACTSPGLTCDMAAQGCNAAASCTCTDGAWLCETPSIEPCPPPVCPAAGQTVPGTSCDPSTQDACNATMSINVCGSTGSVSCSCEADGAGGGSWSCPMPPLPECPDAQPPTCPAPSTISFGGYCDTPSTLNCTTGTPIYGCDGQVDGYITCFCDGNGWNCADPGVPVCADVTPACPDPTTVLQGVSCFAESQQCPGNPTQCGGATLYDAFQCTSGQWVDVATTICDVDGGGGGSGFDGPHDQ